MNKIFQVILKPGYHDEECFRELESKGAEFLYSSENQGLIELVFKSKQTKKSLSKYSFVAECQEIDLPEINWEAQWGLEENENLEIDLKKYGASKNLYIQPGAGFGDLTHPTTQLILEMMANEVKDRIVLDIGSGSGILSLAAKLLGAKKVIGLEIDSKAIQHSLQNLLLNDIKDISFTDQLDITHLNHPLLIVMNMIMSEQKIAYDPLIKKKFPEAIILTSGILKEHLNEYLSLTKAWGWHLEKTQESGEWLGFKFS